MNEFSPPYPAIRDALRNGKVIPFLGSGASLVGRHSDMNWIKGEANCLPTASELARHLAQQTQFPSDEPQDLAKVAQFYKTICGREALTDELRCIFNCDYQVGSLHSYLAELDRPLLIVTTNYDDLIERAFNARNRPFDLVIHTTDPDAGNHILWRPYGELSPRRVIPNRLYIDLNTVTVIYKIHGAVDRHEHRHDQYVITEDDYVDFLVRVVRSTAVPSIFAQPFGERQFLFLGYSLSDWNLRVVLSTFEKGLRRHKDIRRRKDIKSWAIQHNARPLERRFWQDRGVEIYEMTIDNFVKELVTY